MLVMTPGEMGPQGLTSRVREQEAASAVIGARLIWGTFEDGSVPPAATRVGGRPGRRRTGADVIYAHAPNDTHQDHVATSIAALAAGRRTARVLFYQSPSTTGFNPTVFVDVEKTLGDKLVSLRAHWSQVMQCEWSTSRPSRTGARYWGSRAKVSYAEAFETPALPVGDRRPGQCPTSRRPRDPLTRTCLGTQLLRPMTWAPAPCRCEFVSQLAPPTAP